MSTKIEWTDLTVNPGIYGCEEVSPACANCYAATMAHRQVAMGNYPVGITEKRASGVHWSGLVLTSDVQSARVFSQLPQRLKRCKPCSGSGEVTVAAQETDSVTGVVETVYSRQPCTACEGKGKRPHRAFVMSMADVFHKDVPSHFIGDLFESMRARPHIHFQLLTKRPDRMAAWSTMKANEYMNTIGEEPWTWPHNVWAGTTVEDQKRADERIPWLLRVPAKVRFLSCEPLLGPIDLHTYLLYVCAAGDRAEGCGWRGHGSKCVGNDWRCPRCYGETCPTWDYPSSDGVESGIHWVIAGGESGRRARPSHPNWFRSIRQQCANADVPFLFKQWGEWAPGNDYAGADLYDRDRTRIRSGFFTYAGRWHEGCNPFRQTMDRVGKLTAGRQLDGQTHDSFPRFPSDE